MKLLATVAVLGTLAIAAVSNPLSAQWVWLGGGATFPTSDLGEVANTGYNFMVGVATDVGASGLNVGVEAFYGQNNHDTDGNKSSPYGFQGSVGYNVSGPDADQSVYVFGTLGALWHKFTSETLPTADSSEAGFAYGGGAGYFFPLGSLSGWIEGRFTQASITDANVQYFGINAGVSIPLGS
jgi:hypothetical protein